MKEPKCHVCGGNIDGHFHLINGEIVEPKAPKETEIMFDDGLLLPAAFKIKRTGNA